MASGIASISVILGIDNIAGIQMGVHLGPSYSIAGWKSVPILLIVAIILGGISKFFWSLLRKYFASISSQYRRLVPKSNIHI
ncbi:hypothetical protein [Thermoflavimicrobium dichotomicum]|uniref:hypothetical protein n=1 Tax=Thermoflavimicrobium dichotomicum TaxID=46223 RepID=UPI001113AF8D|nr:hypothetical protein [Thermoflavimicrobium dichotomicum]